MKKHKWIRTCQKTSKFKCMCSWNEISSSICKKIELCVWVGTPISVLLCCVMVSLLLLFMCGVVVSWEQLPPQRAKQSRTERDRERERENERERERLPCCVVVLLLLLVCGVVVFGENLPPKERTEGNHLRAMQSRAKRERGSSHKDAFFFFRFLINWHLINYLFVLWTICNCLAFFFHRFFWCM